MRDMKHFSDIGQALEGKDVKDLLLNVGSGGGAAAAPASGGAGGAATGGDDAPAAEEKKEEGTLHTQVYLGRGQILTVHREGGVRRRHGLRTLRLSVFSMFLSRYLPYSGCSKRTSGIFPVLE
jgi:hypothetical protein